MREAKENYRNSNSIINTTSSFGGKHRKISHNSRIGSKRSFDHDESSTRGSAGYSLNFQGQKKSHQHQRASHSSHSRFTSIKQANIGELHASEMKVCFLNIYPNSRNICTCVLTSFQLVAFPSKYQYGRASPQILKCFRLLKE